MNVSSCDLINYCIVTALSAIDRLPNRHKRSGLLCVTASSSLLHIDRHFLEASMKPSVIGKLQSLRLLLYDCSRSIYYAEPLVDNLHCTSEALAFFASFSLACCAAFFLFLNSLHVHGNSGARVALNSTLFIVFFIVSL